jgi:tetratricopeptide (TPR) repeat protein/predicted RNA-binding Zn-ribbon protein involved in translation (DUF1610 family)
MAVPKQVCGSCNAVIAATDTVCPSCREPIEREAGAKETPCPVCGHRNASGRETCVSCGVRLLPARPKNRGERKKEKRRPRKAERSRPGVDYWPYIAAGAVVVLLGVLIYFQVTGENTVRTVPGTAESGSASAALPPPIAVNGPTSQELEEMDAAVKARPNDVGALLRLANALHDSRLLPRAIDTYKKYLSLRPKDPDARTDLGICYFQMAQTDSANAEPLLRKAAKEMEEAHAANPTHQASAFNLGIVYLHLNDIEQSNSWLRKAAAINAQSDLGIKAQSLLNQHGVIQ